MLRRARLELRMPLRSSVRSWRSAPCTAASSSSISCCRPWPASSGINSPAVLPSCSDARAPESALSMVEVGQGPGKLACTPPQKNIQVEAPGHRWFSNQPTIDRAQAQLSGRTKVNFTSKGWEISKPRIASHFWTTHLNEHQSARIECCCFLPQQLASNSRALPLTAERTSQPQCIRCAACHEDSILFMSDPFG